MQNKYRHLIKEGEHNIISYTKLGTREKIITEVTSNQFFEKLGLTTPRIIVSTQNSITMELINGISVFRAMELLITKGGDLLVYKILDELCHGIKIFQENFTGLDLHFEKYAVKNKVTDILEFIKVVNPKLHILDQRFIEKIDLYYDKADMPFRDATPKNYFFKNINNDNLEFLNDDFKSRIVYFDFSTLNSLTFSSDDFISVLFHYFVDSDIRNDLLKKYRIDMESEENIICAFVRLGRFWVRRHYYKRYNGGYYCKRYLYEDMNFYDNIFYKYLNKIVKLIY